MIELEGKRRLAAILSADVAGYSRLMQADETATIAALNDARKVFRTRVDAGHGRVVDTAGDSVLAVFDSVIEAVKAAIEIQATLAESTRDVPADRRMRFRIGVNLGDVIEQSDGTVYGDGINIAARLEAQAEPGGICVSGAAHHHIHGKLDVGFRDLGPHEVKNIAEPIQVYAVVMDGAAAAPAAPADEPVLELPDKPSIAVLPFDNMGGDPDQAFFADGITEDLITALSHIRWLFVTARNSTAQYKGQTPDLREVGRDLGVRYVLEGSVRRGGNRIRVTAQLIDATTGNHVWAQRYDRELDDMFALQDEITATLAAAIAPELDAAERDRAQRKPPENLDAWESYQRGLGHLYRYNATDNIEAKRFLEQSIARDANFSPPHAALAYALTLDFLFGHTESQDRSRASALHYARRSIELDDRDAFGHMALSRALLANGDYEDAIAAASAAVDLNPNLAWAHYCAGHALYMAGQPDAAIPEFEAASRQSPHDPLMWIFEAMLALAHLQLHDLDKAIETARRGTRRPAAGIWLYLALAVAFIEQRKMGEAKQALDRLLALKPDFAPADMDKFARMRDRDFVQRMTDALREIGLATAS